MVEQPDTGEDHAHAIFVTGGDDVFVAVGAAGFDDVARARKHGAVDAVAEGEEGVGTEADAFERVEPGAAFGGRELGWDFAEDVAPVGFFGFGHIGLQELVDGVVAVGAFDAFLEGQVEYFGALAQVPQVGLGACQAHTMDA